MLAPAPAPRVSVNLQLLIDSIVRQTTVLIAQLATTGGARAPLVTVANQVFLDLADELAHQGVSRSVSADMFGLALRTYLRKIQRLRESTTEHGKSLWEAVLEYLDGSKLVTRTEILRRFHRDDAEVVGAVLKDLSDSGLVLRIGSGGAMAYRSATKDELEALASVRSSDGTDELVWALVFREGPISRSALAKRLRHGDVDAIVERLVAAGRVRLVERGGAEELVADHFVVPAGAEVGWEAAVFDHFQAVVKTVCARLRGQETGPQGSAIGGSTYSFDVWPGHPLEADVLNLLRDLRQRVGDVRARVRSYNSANVRPKSYSHVTFYGGQSVIVEEGDSEV